MRYELLFCLCHFKKWVKPVPPGNKLHPIDTSEMVQKVCTYSLRQRYDVVFTSPILTGKI